MNKPIKIALSCAVILLLFIGGSIAAVSDQTNSRITNTAIIKNESKYKQLELPINPVHLLPGQMITPSGRIVNRTDLENLSIIKIGTIKLPNGTHGMARIKAFEEARGNLVRELNMSHDEWLRTECNATGECIYQVIKKHVSNTTLSPAVVPSVYSSWVEDATYYESGGTNILSAQWTVPSAPTNTSGQTIFYFPGLQNGTTGGVSFILQPVLEWGQHGNFWDISAWYAGGDNSGNQYSNYVTVNVGDGISGVVQQDPYNAGYWDVDIYDVTQDTHEGIVQYDTTTYSYNYVTLEVVNVNTCDQFPRAADFTNLVVDSVTPSWTPEQSQTGCGLGVNIVSPSEVILNTRGPLVEWNYSKVKTITGTTAGAQTNYQMKLTVYNSSGTDTPGNVYLGGNARSDFGDLRFTKSDGVTLLDYWIESYTSGVSAVVWVEVDSIPASPNNTSIYLYYGNPSATSSSSGAATFSLFDDFNTGSSIDTGNWTVNRGDQNISGGILALATYDRTYIRSIQTFGVNTCVRTRVKIDTSAYGTGGDKGYVGYASGTGRPIADPYQGYTVLDWYTYANQYKLMFDTAVDSSHRAEPLFGSTSSNPRTTFVIDELRRLTSAVYVYENDSQLYSYSSAANIPTNAMPVVMGAAIWSTYYDGAVGAAQYDWILVRNFVSPEPAWVT